MEFVDRETLRLTAEGIWLSNGEEVTHPAQIRAFFRGIGRDERGYFIRVGRDFKRIEVEDTAYFVLGLEGSAEAGYRVRLSDGAVEALDAETLRYREGRLTCRISRGGHPEEARFSRARYHEILRGLQADSRGYFLVLRGRRIALAEK